MLCRLGELRMEEMRQQQAAAKMLEHADDEEEEQAAEEEEEGADAVGGSLWKPPETKEPTEAECDEYLEFLDEMSELFHELMVDEGTARAAIGEIDHHVDMMEETIQFEKEALLPTKLAQMTNRFEGQELVCQRMINRAKGVLEILREGRDDEPRITAAEADQRHWCRKWCCPIHERLVKKAPEYLEPVRQSLSKVRTVEYKRLVSRFFTARSANKAEVISRTGRQLAFAFPEAKPHELEQVMEFPESAITAITLRLEMGEKITAESFIQELEADPEKEAQKKLEQGAKELKLMMLQFSELIDNQGEALDQIEANIKAVLQDTTDAIDILNETLRLKKASERNNKFTKMLWCCCMWFAAVFILKVLTSWVKMLSPSGLIQTKQWELAREPLWSTKKQKVRRHFLHQGALQEDPREDHYSREEKSWVASKHPRRGFIAPHVSSVEKLVDHPVIRGVALTARGAASRQKSALRKRTGAIQQDNTTDT